MPISVTDGQGMRARGILGTLVQSADACRSSWICEKDASDQGWGEARIGKQDEARRARYLMRGLIPEEHLARTASDDYGWFFE
jgi:hypothetical protein